MDKKMEICRRGPTYLFDHLEDIRQQLLGKERLALFLDLDGTLTPIAPSPSTVKLKPAVADALEALAADENNTVTIISGRALEDVQRLVNVPKLIYAGNHGLEISGSGVHYVQAEATQRVALIAAICETLEARLRNIEGALVEYKRLSASIHYRLVAKPAIQELRKLVRNEVEIFDGDIILTEGKRVIEIRPAVAWHKGSATRWVLRELGFAEDAAIYAGDDRTDEDAFIALPQSITIRVGAHLGSTTARYYVRTPDGVLSFLQCLEKVRACRAARYTSAAAYGATGSRK